MLLLNQTVFHVHQDITAPMIPHFQKQLSAKLVSIVQEEHIKMMVLVVAQDLAQINIIAQVELMNLSIVHQVNTELELVFRLQQMIVQQDIIV